MYIAKYMGMPRNQNWQESRQIDTYERLEI
jgi:hypothetical protein